MSFIDAIKEKLVGHAVAGNKENAMAGKIGGFAKTVWMFLDGWKAWIVAVVAVYKLMCHDCQSYGYLHAIISALGWDGVQGAFDPAQAAMAAGVVVALGHTLVKAYSQYKAGVPLKYVRTDAGAVIADDINLGAHPTAAVANQVAKEDSK